MGVQLDGDDGPAVAPPGELFEQHRPRLYRHVLRKVGDPAAAEDLVQETYLRFHRGYDSLKDKAALGGWLRSIADHLCIDYFRSSASQRSAIHDPQPTEDQPHGEPPDSAPSPLRIAEKSAQST